MTDTTRDLIQRLADALAEWQLGGAPPEDTSDVDLINEARAFLDQPEPKTSMINCRIDGPPPSPHQSWSDWFYQEGSKGILHGLRISAMPSRGGKSGVFAPAELRGDTTTQETP